MGIKRMRGQGPETSWFGSPFESRSKNLLAILFVLAVVLWALVVPFFGESWTGAVLHWLQPPE